MHMPNIAFQNKDIIIADKAHGVPTVPLKRQSSMEGTLLGDVASVCPDVLSVKGRNEWEFGTLHRLDTATSGLVVFAKNQDIYDHLQRMQAGDCFTKVYRALTTESARLKGKDVPEELLQALGEGSEIEVVSYFRSYGPGSRQVRPIQDIRRADSPVRYRTRASKDGNLFTCTITRGFRHQIRSHLAWLGFPIMGDPLYGDPCEDGSQILELDCFSVSFPLPDGSVFTFSR